MTPPLTYVRVRTPGELDPVLAIDRLSFPHPWTRAMYENDLAVPQSHVYLARDGGGAAVGYFACWVVADELQVNNVAVAPAWRRQGVGRALVNEMLAVGARLGAHVALLEVRAANDSAIALYERCGFEISGRRNGYYSEPADDALLMLARIQVVGDPPGA